MNRVVLAGILAEAPELRELESGPAVCFLKLRCIWNQTPHLLGDEGQQDVNVILLGEKARKMAPYLYDDRRMVVDGSLASASWEQSDGRAGEAVCVLGERVEFFGEAPAGAEGYGDARSEASPMVGFSEDMWL